MKIRRSYKKKSVKAVMAKDTEVEEKSQKKSLKAIVSIEETVGTVLSNVVTGGIDGITDLAGKSFLLELLSEDLDPGKFNLFNFFSFCFLFF